MRSWASRQFPFVLPLILALIALPSALANFRSPRPMSLFSGVSFIFAKMPRLPPFSSFSRSYFDIFGAVIGFCFL